MSGREFAVEPDRWSLPQRRTFALRGPLRTLPHRRARPLWPMCLGVAGLSLAAAFMLAPRSAPVPADPVPRVVAEMPPTPRVVGAAEVPIAATAAVDIPAVEPPALRAQPGAPPPQPPAAPALDVGQLPTLHLDASAFDAAPIVEAPPRASAKPPARHAAPRLSGQP